MSEQEYQRNSDAIVKAAIEAIEDKASTMTTPTPDEQELREALKKDFHKLYVKQFTADFKVKRLVRDIEIDIMPLDNLQAHTAKAVSDVLDRLEVEVQDIATSNLSVAYATSIPTNKVLHAIQADRQKLTHGKGKE